MPSSEDLRGRQPGRVPTTQDDNPSAHNSSLRTDFFNMNIDEDEQQGAMTEDEIREALALINKLLLRASDPYDLQSGPDDDEKVDYSRISDYFIHEGGTQAEMDLLQRFLSFMRLFIDEASRELEFAAEVGAALSKRLETLMSRARPVTTANADLLRRARVVRVRGRMSRPTGVRRRVILES